MAARSRGRMGCVGSCGENSRRRPGYTHLSVRRWRSKIQNLLPPRQILTTVLLQIRTVQTALTVLQSDNIETLPPLMNPSILEASDDLTNLSHLNEPAGVFSGSA